MTDSRDFGQDESSDLRVAALNYALKHSSSDHPSNQIVKMAEDFYKFLVPSSVPVFIYLSVGDVHEQGAVDVRLTDTQQVDLTAREVDAKGSPVREPLTWSSDNTAVAVVVPSADTFVGTVVAQLPGVCTITVTDGTLTAHQAIEVLPGQAVSMSIAEGVPTNQPVPGAE